MSPERWATVSRITADALEVPDAARVAWLAQACAGDDALRREVESLLVASVEAGGFLAAPTLSHLHADGSPDATATAGAPLDANPRVGSYRVVRELGHGGMGVVYLAARDDDAFDKLVALKVMRGWLTTDALERRFGDERRILARLEHPHIARLLDGGTTADGLPYLVMEYVDGAPIDEYCARHRLSLPERLRLFQRVCEAVQYAHQRLVIHRDIKPRNILVTPDGTPKLLDFGIARLVDGDGTASGTHTALRAFTPEYASPEQVRGEPMTLASDVYALGVLMFELVTGTRPFAASSEVGVLQAICEASPVRPVDAARVGTGLPVDVELEWVILEALRKEPARRYQSVQALSDDVGRLLKGLPVSAAPDSLAYRARKLVGRNRLAVAAGVLLAVSLAAGVMATLWQSRRADVARALAEERLQSTRRLANAMVFEVNDALEAGSTGARALLLQRASEQLDALAASAPDDPVLGDEVATAYHRLGDLLGRTGAAHTGNRPEGLARHRKGLAIRQALVAHRPQDLDARARLVQSLMDTAFAEDEIEPSFRHARGAVEHAEELAAARPDDLPSTRLLASAHYTLGAQYRAIGDSANALLHFERATPLFQRVYDAAPDAEARRSLALCEKRLGAIRVERQEFVEALSHLRRAVNLDTASVRENPSAAARQRDLSTSNIQLGFALLNSGDVEGAVAAYRAAQSIRQRLVEADPTSKQTSRDLASVLWYLGVAESTRGRYPDAIALLEKADGMTESTAFNGDDFPATIAKALGDAHEGAGRLETALDSRRQALARRQLYLRRQTGNHKLRVGVVSDALTVAGTLRKMADQSPPRRRALQADACATLAGVRQIDLSGTEEGTARAAALRDALLPCAGS